MQIFNLIMLSIIIEGIVSYVKEWFVDNHFQWQQLVTVILGIIIAVCYDVDLLAMFGATSQVPYIGCVLTGILLSRGSNYIFDLIKKLQDQSIVDIIDENAKG